MGPRVHGKLAVGLGHAASLCRVPVRGAPEAGSSHNPPPHPPHPGRQAGIQKYLPLEGPGSHRTNIRSLWNFSCFPSSYPKDPGAAESMCTHTHTHTRTHTHTHTAQG